MATQLPAVIWSILLLLPCFLIVTHAQILSSLEFKLREEQPPGSYVGHVGIASKLATSLSENEYSRLKFNLPDSKYFKVDEKTGSLSSAVKIDREEVCDSQLLCKLTNQIIVYTSIGAGSYDIMKVITIDVEILDINDNSPEFPNRAVVLTISESNDIDQVLRTRSAVDKDIRENSVKQYRFQDFTDTFRLTVHKNPDGSSYLGIVVKERLDREVKDFYQVTVIAMDGGIPQRSGLVVINITVTDINDNSPEFTYSSYNETMQENMALNVPIMKARATDQDDGKNAEISYQFSSRVSNKIRQKFYIDDHTGEIFAQSNIDYEEDKLFQFIVEAVDNGTPQHSSRTNVNLHVIDMNDNAPQIVLNLPPTGTEIMENEAVGKFVAHVSAVDLDSGTNGAISCTMDDPHFSLNKFSENSANRFKVILTATLDYEQSTYHRVSITCTDGGSPALSNSTSFVVSVVDANDNKPTFTELKYFVSVLENQEDDVEVLEVTAHDWDSGESGKVLYFLADTHNGLFSVHQSAGILKVVRALDRESNPRYELYIIARDNGHESLSSSALVVVTVQDLNDEPPRFPSPIYFMDVLENQPSGTSVGVASAVDRDSPGNARMHYSILQHGVDHIHFAIDPTTGVITSKVSFDREEKDQHHFMVKVVDPTKPIFYSVANFTVRVLDVNDHSPVIQVTLDENATLFIENSSPVGSIITNIVAHDGDDALSQHLTYLIEKGDPDQLFHLDPYTGALTLARIINSRDLKTYSLVIFVEDSGDPPRFDRKELNVKVNGTIPPINDEGFSEHIIIAAILVCVTVVLTLVTVAIIIFVKKLDRKRRRKRNNQKNSEDAMYQLNKDELFPKQPLGYSEDSNSLIKKGKKDNRLSGSTVTVTGPDAMTEPLPADKQLNARRAHFDEECRLIDILKRNRDDDDAASEASEDTDPSDSGRGGSEDETNPRGSVIAQDHSGKRQFPQSYHQRPPPSIDKSKQDIYHQQKYLPPKPTPQVSASSSKNKPHRFSATSMRSPQSSVTSDIDSGISDGRSSQSRSELDRSFNAKNNPEKSEVSKRLSSDSSTFRNNPRMRENSTTGSHTDYMNANAQSSDGQPGKRFPTPPLTKTQLPNHTSNANSTRYPPQTRQYKYTDRTYPLSGISISPTSFPEEDDRTTTSGSYTVNPEDLRHDLDVLVLHDTVV